MKNFITTENWSKNELQDILDYAKDLKINRFQKTLKNKSIGLVFFNPSMRTRTSFEIGILNTINWYKKYYKIKS